MEIAALILAVVALGVAYLAVRRAGALDQRLSRLESSLYSLKSDIMDQREALDEQFMELRLEMQRQRGGVQFTPSMTMAEAMAVHPRVNDVLGELPSWRLLALRRQRRGYD